VPKSCSFRWNWQRQFSGEKVNLLGRTDTVSLREVRWSTRFSSRDASNLVRRTASVPVENEAPESGTETWSQTTRAQRRKGRQTALKTRADSSSKHARCGKYSADRMKS